MRRMRKLVALAAVSALFLVGCGSSSEDDTDPLAGGPPASQDEHGGHTDHAGNATSECSPSGTTLSITASDTTFNKDCLAAPAGQAFTVNFDNKDSLTHNLMILESHSATEALFDAGPITGPGVKTLNVPGLQAGTFAFHCKFHPGAMSGTFVVK